VVRVTVEVRVTARVRVRVSKLGGELLHQRRNHTSYLERCLRI